MDLRNVPKLCAETRKLQGRLRKDGQVDEQGCLEMEGEDRDPIGLSGTLKRNAATDGIEFGRSVMAPLRDESSILLKLTVIRRDASTTSIRDRRSLARGSSQDGSSYLPILTLRRRPLTVLSSKGSVPVRSAYRMTPQLQISVEFP